MIKKLKYKFIGINMILLSTVLLIIFGSIYFLMYKSGKDQAHMMMQTMAKNEGVMPRPLPRTEVPYSRREVMQNPPPIDQMMTHNSISILLNNKNQIFRIVSQTTIEEYTPTIEALVKEVLQREDMEGVIASELGELRYLRMKKPYGQIVVFMGRGMEIQILGNLAKVLSIIGGISLIILFLISLYVSERAIRPVAKAWERQKQFVADASHELKTPLTIIDTNAAVVLASPEDLVSNQIKWIEYIQEETKRMSKLVNNLLYLAKVDSEEEQIVCEKVKLSEVLMHVCLQLESLVFESGKLLKMEIVENLNVTGDRERLKQVILILIDNAIKHTDKKGIIQVRLQKDKKKVKIEVTNTGEGIPPKYLDKIFERFYRVDKSRARETGGYGLGLSIAKTIIKQHGGSIEVESILGDHTTFSVTLPLREID